MKHRTFRQKPKLNPQAAPTWKLIVADRVMQVIIGLVFLFISGGFVLNKGTEGGHEDFATYRLAPIGTELRRDLANRERLGRINPALRPKVEAVLSDLEQNGFYPFIDNAVYRTPAEQMKKYRQGYSKVTYSFHNATSKDGKPDSLAADIADQRYGWSPKTPRKYWLMLARSAQSHGLHSGLFFGLSKTQKANLQKALNQRNWNYKGPIGWDAAHIEPAGMTPSQAQRGLRPHFAEDGTRAQKYIAGYGIADLINLIIELLRMLGLVKADWVST